MGSTGIQERYMVVVLLYFLSGLAVALGWLAAILTTASQLNTRIPEAIDRITCIAPVLLFACIASSSKLKDTALKTNFFTSPIQRDYLILGHDGSFSFQNNNDLAGEGLIDHLPIGTWDMASAQKEINNQKFGKKYRYKIIKGIITGYRLKSLTATNASQGNIRLKSPISRQGATRMILMKQLF